jgi:hypothetical protein
VLRERVLLRRVLVLRAGFAAAFRAGEDFARLAVGFFAALARLLLARDLAVEALARDPVVFRAVDLRAVDLRAVDLRAPLLRAPEERDVVPGAAEPPSSAHLPDITRCAASATASAMSEPSLVALAATLLAAWVAVSAASSPASRIALRAFGLALIAAAAAASPAASISLLIAALAILSTVLRPPPRDFDEDLEALFFADLAIAYSPTCPTKDTSGL